MTNGLFAASVSVGDRFASLDSDRPRHATVRLAARIMLHDGIYTPAQVAALPTDTMFAYMFAAEDLQRLTGRKTG